MSGREHKTSNLKWFVVMGVAGCGKSTIARALAGATGGLFIEGDDFHPAANKEKMAAGIPLTDADRWPWLDRLIQEVRAAATNGKPVFLSCSALKQSYRDHLAAALPGLRFVYLQGSFDVIHERMKSRKGHFMPAALLESQFATLEEPANALTLDVSLPPDQIVERALGRMGISPDC